jgi:hypothetical protein
VEPRNRVEKLKESDFSLFFLFQIPAASFFRTGHFKLALRFVRLLRYLPLGFSLRTSGYAVLIVSRDESRVQFIISIRVWDKIEETISLKIFLILLY